MSYSYALPVAVAKIDVGVGVGDLCPVLHFRAEDVGWTHFRQRGKKNRLFPFVLKKTKNNNKVVTRNFV